MDESRLDLEQRLMHLEDQVDRMNRVLAKQGVDLERAVRALVDLAARVKEAEGDRGSGSAAGMDGSLFSERPPDGGNR